LLMAGLTKRGAKRAIEHLPIELVVRFSVASLLSYEKSLVESKVAEDRQECADEMTRRRART
jgi:hypothetical protein